MNSAIPEATPIRKVVSFAVDAEKTQTAIDNGDEDEIPESRNTTANEKEVSYSDGMDSVNYADAKTHQSNPGDQDDLLDGDDENNETTTSHLYQGSSNPAILEFPKFASPDFAEAKRTNTTGSRNENEEVQEIHLKRNSQHHYTHTQTQTHTQDAGLFNSKKAITSDSEENDLDMITSKPMFDIEIEELWQPEVVLTRKEVWERTSKCFIQEVWQMSWPACLMIVPLHFIQNFAYSSVQAIIQPFMWYGFGVFLYLSLQSTMIGYKITAKLLWLSVS
ncbi:hypothetical protein RFI_14024 [Reticulomyxa filosa]|uniref:Uncharacterized protein n=1 Tax=Reticulomyxa filosa TaxID=46433 RepID=X6NAU1_RETFI|nr:hypothetical protein RFI_14024 [Reticulomyxa filosa]|eukprot:ETO23161.1 hypothetical protein RFI_14024 [Reticulomyxa filosa]